jgi:hypothetical protein
VSDKEKRGLVVYSKAPDTEETIAKAEANRYGLSFYLDGKICMFLDWTLLGTMEKNAEAYYAELDKRRSA